MLCKESLVRSSIWLFVWPIVLFNTGFAADGAQGTGEVAGQVVDRHGNGVHNARVHITAARDSKPLATSNSQDDGRFVLRQVPIGCRMLVFIDAEGFGRDYRDDIDVFPNRTTELSEIRLFPGCVCAGRVVTADGTPISTDIVIQAYRHASGFSISDFGPSWHIKSDAHGSYVTPPLPVSFAIFQAKAPAGSVPVRAENLHIVPDATQLQVADLELVPEVPFEGIVASKSGKPISGAEVLYVGYVGDGEFSSITDNLGRFTLHGLSAKTIPKLQLHVSAAGFGDYFEEEPKVEPTRKVVLSPCGYISGRAIDAETSEPVEIKHVIVCEVRRDADGTPHSYGCGEARFEQSDKGKYRVTVSTSGDKHLTIMAAGYHRAEKYVFGFDLLKGATDLTIRMRKHGSSTTAARQRIRGVARRAGKPAAEVWVGLWQKMEEPNPVNSRMLRGRTVDGTYRPSVIDVLTSADGSYLLDVPDPGSYFVVARDSHGAAAFSQPLSIRENEEQRCDLDLQTGGTIRGRVQGVAPEVAERLWVVAFGHAPYRAAAPVDRSGEFVLHNVPSGEIGLKAGHEGYRDVDVPHFPWSDEVWKIQAEPWKRAVTVTVAEGADTRGIELDYPASGPPDCRAD